MPSAIIYIKISGQAQKKIKKMKRREKFKNTYTSDKNRTLVSEVLLNCSACQRMEINIFPGAETK